MNAEENNLVQSFTGKATLQEVTVSQLEEITSKYPYCSLAQLLLTKKYKKEEHQKLISQIQHCALYFQDITWLQDRLYSKEAVINKAPNKTFSRTDVFESGGSTIDNDVSPTSLRKGGIENANLIMLPADDVFGDFTLQINDVKDEPELPPLEEEELANTDDKIAEASAKIADVLQHQVEEFKAPVEEEPLLPISTEPYHTIDYFASQGIKVDLQTQDAFAKKVHTFTDWLKQMKRISNYPTDLGSDPDMESFVQSIADTSNQHKAVDTETMAEVLVKQGKFDKAIEVYQKLSLLNPDKTAYFAAKINQLKA
jgi:hypothetical protein